MFRALNLLWVLVLMALALPAVTQDSSKPSSSGKQSGKQRKQRPFKWVNAFPEGRHPGLRHGTFYSGKNKTDVGYGIYLPPGYGAETDNKRRYPVIYYLHGGRPGGEQKSISLVPEIHRAIESGQVPPMIYVFVNGGRVSHYDYPSLESWGETSTIRELIPHIDATYRTIAKREGRGIEGFSQGGRGTARFMFKYPELFCTAAPMGGGHQHEKRISENHGDEGAYQFEPGNNSWDLARKFAESNAPRLEILVVVGTKDFNYEANLEWMAHLKALGIGHQRIIVPDTPHSGREVYRKVGERAMGFHARNFEKALGKAW